MPYIINYQKQMETDGIAKPSSFHEKVPNKLIVEEIK
jgi:hypothetical protein